MCTMKQNLDGIYLIKKLSRHVEYICLCEKAFQQSAGISVAVFCII